MNLSLSDSISISAIKPQPIDRNENITSFWVLILTKSKGTGLQRTTFNAAARTGSELISFLKHKNKSKSNHLISN